MAFYNSELGKLQDPEPRIQCSELAWCRLVLANVCVHFRWLLLLLMYSIQIAGFSVFIFTLQRRGEIRNPADYVRGEAGGVGGMGGPSGCVGEWAGASSINGICGKDSGECSRWVLLTFLCRRHNNTNIGGEWGRSQDLASIPLLFFPSSCGEICSVFAAKKNQNLCTEGKITITYNSI